MITSLQNKRVKAAIKLRDRRGRERQGRIVIDGLREIGSALDCGVSVLEAFVCRSHDDDPLRERLCKRLGDRGTELLEVSAPVWEKLTYGNRRDGLLVVALPPSTALAEIESLPANALVVVLDGVEKPGNLGAVIRCVDAAGAHALILSDPRTDVFNPNAIRASVGTVFRIPLAAATASEVQQWLREQKVQVLAARVGAGVLYTKVELVQPTAIVLGSEADGLGDNWVADSIEPIQVPMHGLVDSLNVSITTAVILYEARRQRDA